MKDSSEAGCGWRHPAHSSWTSFCSLRSPPSGFIDVNHLTEVNAFSATSITCGNVRVLLSPHGGMCCRSERACHRAEHYNHQSLPASSAVTVAPGPTRRRQPPYFRTRRARHERHVTAARICAATKSTAALNTPREPFAAALPAGSEFPVKQRVYWIVMTRTRLFPVVPSGLCVATLRPFPVMFSPTIRRLSE